jgi:NADPH-dependent 2,4-dienoyl-CoA reductase/sulfur reductase-like enzyme/nitrite reductase/ring-hydroxylating ferredoxin subunit
MSEHQVGTVETFLQDGEMKRIELEGKPIVLARVQGQYYAFGGKCSHYGAPLQDGVLHEHTVMCPWHHACFDIRSGARLEPPALNDIARYPVQIIDGEVVVTFPNDNITSPQGEADPKNSQTFVIVGGGAAGGAAAEQLRRLGFTGKIIIVSSSTVVPVDRPNLSKDYLDGHAQAEWIPLRGEDWYAGRDIELRLNTHVSWIEPKEHLIYLNDSSTIRYTKLLLATGGVARELKNVEGADLKNIFTLRSLSDADAILQGLESGKRVVVVGASFIGMEVASSLASGRGASVTIVAPEKTPFASIMGDEIGRMYQQVHEEHGVTFCLEDGVTAFKGEGGAVKSVQLKSGRTLDADVVVVGIGVVPATEFLHKSKFTLDEKDHSVLVNSRLQTSDPDIFAAGDIARWSDDYQGTTRIEHWRVAQQQGIVAAHNMLGDTKDISERVPFFWTSQWHLTLNYIGHATSWDEIVYWGGTPAEKKFIAFYFDKGELKAAAGCDYDQELVAVELIFSNGLTLTPDQIRRDGFAPTRYLRSYQES